MCALRAMRNPAQTPPVVNQVPPVQTAPPVTPPPVVNQVPPTQTTPRANVPAVQSSGAVAVPGTVQDLNAGILDNIEGMGNAGNFVTMDGSEFLYKSDNTVVNSIDLVVIYGKRYYQWVEEIGDSKTYHDSDVKLDDRYRLKFEIHWLEDGAEAGDEPITMQFHLPTASAMRFIDYVGQLSKAGFGIASVVTRVTISRQVQKGKENRYSRAEFTMVGIVDPEGNYTEANTGITTINKK